MKNLSITGFVSHWSSAHTWCRMKSVNMCLPTQHLEPAILFIEGNSEAKAFIKSSKEKHFLSCYS